MDRETIAYLLIVVLIVAAIAAAAFAYHNIPARKYKRQLKRDYGARRQRRVKPGAD